MGRYRAGDEGENAFEPRSANRVLKNKLHIIDPAEIGLVESKLLAAAMETGYGVFDSQSVFTFQILCEMHRWWLGTLYEFAGQVRTVNLSKGGILFAPVEHLADALSGLDRTLQANLPCVGMEIQNLATSIAVVHGELVLTHPFREGNGRIARWLADLMGAQAGYPPLDWGFAQDTHARRQAYFDSLRRAFSLDFEPLTEIVRAALLRGASSPPDLTP